jgi:uncharacterized membrane protein
MFRFRFRLSESDKQQIVNAIAACERLTSGEIRIHIEKTCDKLPLDRAIEVFGKLGMHQTADRNGVLIYIATSSQKIAIYGDKAIFNIMGQLFWDATLSILRQHFASGHFAEGIIAAIQDIAEKLKEHFPFDESTDTNELSNEISYDESL